MDEARKLKPQIPLTGNEGIPISHEFEFEIYLDNNGEDTNGEKKSNH
jgi:hypothetical protein